MLREFADEARMGWQLAFLRTFAVPRMARLLTDTGELVHGTRKRAYDTGLIIYEIVHGGFESPRSKQLVSLINRSHRPWPIEGEDLTYVLCAFIVTPIRHIDRFGWRRTTEVEKRSAVEFFGHLGRLMNIARVPQTWAEATGFYDDYEARMVAPSEASEQLSERLVSVLKQMQPRPLRPLAPLVFTALLDDRRISRALHRRPLPGLAVRLLHGGAAAHAAVRRRRSPSDKGIFTPGQVVEGVYPAGYDLGDLGRR